MKFHCAALSVKGKPFHLEVAQPFHSVGYLKTDHVRRPVKKVSVVKESFLSVFVAEVGIGNHPPDLICVCLAVFVSVFDVLIHRPRFPKQTSIFWIYDVELFIPLKVLKCDLLIYPLSSHLNSAPEKSVPFVDFYNVPDVYCHKNLVFRVILQRRRDFKPIIANRLNEGFAFGLVRLICTVVLAITPTYLSIGPVLMVMNDDDD